MLLQRRLRLVRQGSLLPLYTFLSPAFSLPSFSSLSQSPSVFVCMLVSLLPSFLSFALQTILFTQVASYSFPLHSSLSLFNATLFLSLFTSLTHSYLCHLTFLYHFVSPYLAVCTHLLFMYISPLLKAVWKIKSKQC